MLMVIVYILGELDDDFETIYCNYDMSFYTSMTLQN